ncbi:MAG: hypothetical protein CM15mP104_0400 [Gammaproteobacteria bacterium]|nr:MAG: hypothetical protein CM15mP104_0400 [Gammaproteobacteria bacterium]
MKTIRPDEINSYIGKEIGVSKWVTIDQEMINNLQMLHLIINSFMLILSKLNQFLVQLLLMDFNIITYAGIPFSQEGLGLVLEGTKMGLNYGLDK